MSTAGSRVDGTEARWQAQHAAALVSGLVNALRALQGAAPGPIPDVAGLALLDAEALQQRVHALRRRIEAEVPQ